MSELKNESNQEGTDSAADQSGAQVETAGRTELYLLSTAAVAALAGFLYGYDTGIISGALLKISDEFSLNSHAQELVAAAILLGAVLGALGCGKLSGVIGRRKTIMLVAIVFILGVVFCSLSPSALLLGLSRLFLGFAVGGASQIVPVYIAELAPAERRGGLVTYFNVSIGFGILGAALVGTFLRDTWSWRLMIVIAALPAAILAMGMIKLPESPRWLVGQRRFREAYKALGLVRETKAEVSAEVRSIAELHHGSDNPGRGWSELTKPWVRPALVAGLGVAAFTQLSGIEMMIYYTPTFLVDAGIDRRAAMYSALGVALIYLALTVTGKLIVDKVGRRNLCLFTIPGAVVALFLLGLALNMDKASPLRHGLMVASLFGFMVFNSGGIQVVGWLFGSEVYPLSIREKATSLHAATLWGSNLLLTGTALTMVNLLGIGGAMWFYALLNALGFVFILLWVPETKGRSLEQIEQDLDRGIFSPIQQKRADNPQA